MLIPVMVDFAPGVGVLITSPETGGRRSCEDEREGRRVDDESDGGAVEDIGYGAAQTAVRSTVTC